MDVYVRLKELGIELPPPPPPGGLYTPVMPFGDKFLYTSGVGPAVMGGFSHLGKLGSDLSIQEGQEAARIAVCNLLANVHQEIGDLNRIKKFVKLLGFVASSDDFTSQPQVMNGASQLLMDVFGEVNGKAARSAIGVNVLPGNIPVEIEALIELK